MLICYVDEAGCTGVLPDPSSSIQPLFVVCGLVVDQARIHDLTKDLLGLKRRFFPRSVSPGTPALGWILVEIKGAEIRKQLAAGSKRQRRYAIGLLDNVLDLLEKHECRLIGRVWVKGIAAPFDGRAVYTWSIQYVHQWFNAWLEGKKDQGLVICDSRNKQLNTVVSHSIFTEKFRVAGDKHPRILEMPTFGHSENHAGLQLADLVCSALLFPMAVNAYCAGVVASVHVRPEYVVLRDRYAARLEALQHRVHDTSRVPPRLVGGVMVNDQLGRKPRNVMFSAP